MQHRNWEYAFQHAVDSLLLREDFNLEKLVEIVWNIGILDRIAPLDKSVLLTRLGFGNLVFSGGRDNPELYYRIIYSCEQMTEAHKKNHEISRGYCLAAYRAGFSLVMRKKEYDQDVISRIFDMVKEKANQELEKKGIKPISVFARGTRGFFKGIQVILVKILYDGRVAIMAVDQQDAKKLKVFLDEKEAIVPTELHSANFVVLS